MKLDRFQTFALLTADQQQLIQPYLSPDNEQSIVKRVPLSQLDQVKSVLSKLMPVRVIYRGPRRDAMRLFCLRRDARSAAIYQR